MYFPRADHLRQRDADLGGAHGTRQRYNHLAAFLGKVAPPLRNSERLPGVEMPEVLLHELCDCSHTKSDEMITQSLPYTV